MKKWFSVEKNGTTVCTTISLALPIDNSTVTISKRDIQCDLEFTVHRSITYDEATNKGLICIFVIISFFIEMSAKLN